MDITVTWKSANGRPLPESFNAFVLGTVYQADIVLKAKAGYSFDPAISFKYYSAGAAAKPPVEDFSTAVRVLSTITYFPASGGIEIPVPIDLTSLVIKPIAGRRGVTGFYAVNHTGSWGGTVRWTNEGAEAAGPFQALTVYRAEVSLYPAPGYAFPENVPVTHNSAGRLPAFTRAGDGTVSLTIAFPATGTNFSSLQQKDIKN
jgi:hypothetical protein